MRRHLVHLFTLALLAAPLLPGAQPPNIGEKAPDFTLPSVAGEPVKFSDLTAKSPVALVVLRGYPGYQCPFCQRQVQDFIDSAKEFESLGVQVVFVYPGPPDKLTAQAGEFMANKAFPKSFTMLLDPGYKFTEQYGLRWNAARETAYPSTFLFDESGTVFYSQVAKLHGGRTSAAVIAGYFKSLRRVKK